MIDPDVRVKIRHYFFAEHWKIGTIAAELQVHPDTVRRAIEVEKFQNTVPLRAVVSRILCKRRSCLFSSGRNFLPFLCPG